MAGAGVQLRPTALCVGEQGGSTFLGRVFRRPSLSLQVGISTHIYILTTIYTLSASFYLISTHIYPSADLAELELLLLQLGGGGGEAAVHHAAAHAGHRQVLPEVRTVYSITL